MVYPPYRQGRNMHLRRSMASGGGLWHRVVRCILERLYRTLEQRFVARLRQIAGLVVMVVAVLAANRAVAQDPWKECELADRDPDRSIAACSKVLARSSNRAHAAAFHNRGLAFAAKGNLDQAISDVTAGIRLDPQRAYRWQERGELYTRQGKYQQAIADITEAIRIDAIPRAFRFHSRAGAYRSLGNLTRAIADFDEAIRLHSMARAFRS
jgi:tetratricopeptide (TPR) repeat protein